MTFRRFLSRRRFVRVAVLVLLVPSQLFAASLLWTTVIADPLCTRSVFGRTEPHIWATRDHCNTILLAGTNVSIEHRTYATNADTGLPVSCGGTVAPGTRVTFGFDRMRRSDIVWNGTGGYLDTPFGHWRADASAPGRFCDAGDAVAPTTVSTSYSWTMQLYFPLAVNPPARSISVTGSGFDCRAPEADGSVVCTAGASGSAEASYTIAPTFGHFYNRFSGGPDAPAAYQGCHGDDDPLRHLPLASYNSFLYTQYVFNPPFSDFQAYRLVVPEQTDVCRIDVGTAATPPPSPSVAAAGACVVGRPLTLRLTSTSSEPVRFAIDWNGNGSADTVLPADEYAASGEVVHAHRAFALPGTKTIGVLALTAAGATSSWQTLTIICAPPSDTDHDDDLIGGDGDDTDDRTADDTLVADWDTSETGLDLKAFPRLLRSGQRARLDWRTSGMTDCTLTAPNGDRWTGERSPVAGVVSKPISARTVYTLSCLDRDSGERRQRSVALGTVPNWREQ